MSLDLQSIVISLDLQSFVMTSLDLQSILMSLYLNDVTWSPINCNITWPPIICNVTWCPINCPGGCGVSRPHKVPRVLEGWGQGVPPTPWTDSLRPTPMLALRQINWYQLLSQLLVGLSYAMHDLHQLANFDFELWTSHHNFIAIPYHFPSVYPLPAYCIVFKNPRKTTNPVTQWSTISTSITRPHT